MFGSTKIPHLFHLLDMETLDATIIQYLFSRADYYLTESLQPDAVFDLLKGKIVTSLFFEPSTRTRISFEIAAKQLGAICLSPHMATSATVKGESLLDTVHTYEAMGTDIFIVRHADNNTAQFIASELFSNASIINGGDGNNQHPSQALLDLYTIQKHKPLFTELKVAIIGDIMHSRVARSLIMGLKIMGTESIHLIAPPTLISEDYETLGVKVFEDIEKGLEDVDVIVTLRIQKERMEAAALPDPDKFHKEYGLTKARLNYAKPNAIVMHPGPVIRGIEIDSDVADGPQSVILEQVTNGVSMRMAIMDTVIHAKKVG